MSSRQNAFRSRVITYICLCVAFYTLSTIRSYAEPIRTVPIRTGIDMEIVGSAFEALSRYVDLGVLEKYRKLIPDGVLAEGYLLDGARLDKLPESVRADLTRGLNLSSQLVMQSPKKEIIVSGRESRILGPNGEPWDPSLDLPTTKPIVAENEKIIHNKLPAQNDWPVLQSRWKSCWAGLSLDEKRLAYDLGFLPLSVRADLSSAYFDEALKINGKINKAKTIPFPVDPSAPDKVQSLFKRIVISYDINDALELKHERPLEDSHQTANDLMLLATIANTSRNLTEPQNDQTRHLTTYHIHYSREGANLSAIVAKLNLLALLRFTGAGRADQLIGFHAVGNISFDGSNTPFMLARNYRSDGTVEWIAKDHFEVKTQILPFMESHQEIIELLSLPADEMERHLEKQILPLFTEENVRAIVQRSLKATKALLDSKIHSQWMGEVFHKLSQEGSAEMQLNVSLALDSTGKNLSSELLAVGLLSKSPQLYQACLTVVSKRSREEPSLGSSVANALVRQMGATPNYIVLSLLAENSEPAPVLALYSRLNAEERAKFLIIVSRERLALPEYQKTVLGEMGSTHGGLARSATNRLPDFSHLLPIDQVLEIIEPELHLPMPSYWVALVFQKHWNDPKVKMRLVSYIQEGKADAFFAQYLTYYPIPKAVRDALGARGQVVDTSAPNGEWCREVFLRIARTGRR